MNSAFALMVLLLKITSILAFCGGPLVLADLLKTTSVPGDIAFAIAISPCAALVFGAYSLWRPEPDRWDHAMVVLGVLGATALVGMNIYAVHMLAQGYGQANEGLIRIGIGVGLLFVAYYAHASTRFFRSWRSAA